MRVNKSASNMKQKANRSYRFFSDRLEELKNDESKFINDKKVILSTLLNMKFIIASN